MSHFFLYLGEKGYQGINNQKELNMNKTTTKYLISVLFIGLSSQVYAEGESVTIKQQVKVLKRQVRALKTDLSEIEFTPTGTALGEMQYWDGNTWQIINAPDMNTAEAQVLTFVNGAFSWNGANDPSGTLYAIGDVGPAGGWVFYITKGGLHGLEAAPIDQDSASDAEWGCYLETVPGLFSSSGSGNTDLILAHNCSIEPDFGGKTHDAAILTNNYTLNRRSDWYLPSLDELNLMYTHLHENGVGDFALGGYWSSSQSGSSDAQSASSVWRQNFNDGVQSEWGKDNKFNVRAVRSF
jgi:hypothetical protein